MFNTEAASQAKERLQTAVAGYNDLLFPLQVSALALHELRAREGGAAVRQAERFINSIADHPKEFDQAIEALKLQLVEMGARANLAVQQFEAATQTNAAATGGAVAVGAGVATMGPTLAIAIATTFGTASTGTAIASLSGAAATKAALALLGGGSLAAGGGGMSAGAAFLALAGPVGWSIAGVSVAGGLAVYWKRGLDFVEDVEHQLAAIQLATDVVQLSSQFIAHLRKSTDEHAAGIAALAERLSMELPASYHEFSDDQLSAVGALVNHVQVLCDLNKRTVAEYLARVDAFALAQKRMELAGRQDASKGARAHVPPNRTPGKLEATATRIVLRMAGSAAAAAPALSLGLMTILPVRQQSEERPAATPSVADARKELDAALFALAQYGGADIEVVEL